MSWFVADQYGFYLRDILAQNQLGFSDVALTIISDKLSGDDDFRRKNEQNFRKLIDPDGEGMPITLTRSSESDKYPGDLLVDNLAGWLNAAISQPNGEFAESAGVLASKPSYKGWHELIPSETTLQSTLATARLSLENEP